MKAWGRLLAAAGAVLFLLATAAGASAASRAHRRHVQVFPASNDAVLYLGEHDGYEIGVSFKEPDNAILFVETFDQERQVYTSTAYGAHFRGSLPFGRLRAHFGRVGSISVRFRPEGKGHSGGRATDAPAGGRVKNPAASSAMSRCAGKTATSTLRRARARAISIAASASAAS